VPANQVIVREGDVGDRFYLIARGSVEINRNHATDGARVLNVLEDGDYFGEIALLDQARRTASVRSRTPCISLWLANQHFEQLLAEESGVRTAIERAARERRPVGVRPA
jgi:ATP-binding cassette subfamily B protein